MTVQDFDIQFLKNRNSLLGFLINKSQDLLLSEDLIQELYIHGKIAIEKGKYNEKGKFRGWLMFLARNLLVDRWRVENARNIWVNIGDFEIFDHLHEVENFEDRIVQREMIEQNLKAVETLRVNQKEVYKMHVVEGLMFKEIAEKRNTTSSAVIGIMRYARKNLKKAI